MAILGQLPDGASDEEVTAILGLLSLIMKRDGLLRLFITRAALFRPTLREPPRDMHVSSQWPKALNSCPAFAWSLNQLAHPHFGLGFAIAHMFEKSYCTRVGPCRIDKRHSDTFFVHASLHLAVEL
jgi:hypothetical protein